MFFIIKKELIWYFKNPIYYIGAILVFFLVYLQCKPYLTINYFHQSQIREILTIEKTGDTDIMDGYIPVTAEEGFDISLKKLRNDLINSIGVDEKQVNEVINYIKDNNMSKDDAIKFVESKYSFIGNVRDYFYSVAEMKKGTAEELNTYIEAALDKEDYADYFGRKYVDYLGIGIFFYSLILLAFLSIYDYKKDIYELLHTKPIQAWKYVLSKAIGGVLAVCFVVVILTFTFDIILVINGIRNNLPINVLNLWKYVFICNIPVIFYISFLYLLISGLFKTPIPAIPILFLQAIYSNTGMNNRIDGFHYVHKIGSIMIRFPEKFFETGFSNVQYLNQGVLIAITVLLAYFAIYQWKRRRI